MKKLEYIWWMQKPEYAWGITLLAYEVHRKFIIDGGDILNWAIDEQLWAIKQGFA